MYNTELIIAATALAVSLISLLVLAEHNDRAGFNRVLLGAILETNTNMLERIDSLDKIANTVLEENKSLREQLNILGDCCEMNSIQLKSLKNK